MKLNILIIMDPLIEVPPKHYGGIERVVADLINGLMEKGHDVTLWASPNSNVSCRFKAFGKEGEWSRFSNIRNILRINYWHFLNYNKFDIIHNFGRLFYMLGIINSKTAKVQTYMRRIDPDNIRRLNSLNSRNIHYTAVSEAIKDTGSPGGGDWSVIYNCAPETLYKLNSNVDPEIDPLVFLGRLERCKGAHTAISVAKKLNRKLIIAGNISDLPEEKEYFYNELEPRIDGELIEYIGTVDDQQKKKLLENSAALMLPIEWLEPFPIVLPEALLCGTPVISFRMGGVPEGIEHGKTGFICDTEDEMAESVLKLSMIDRSYCRKVAVKRFSTKRIIDDYENLYINMLNENT